jgi:predicted Zn-dependent peptidase
MLFRGSEHYPHSYALNNAIEERCGMLSGETGRDYSLYQLCMHPDDLGESLAILGDLFSSPKFSDIDLERAIVLEEILDDFDEKGQRVNIDDVAREVAFPDHPLGFPITGPEKNIRSFSRADVVRHFRRCHSAQNMVLAIAGPNPYVEVKRLAQKAFTGLIRGNLVTALPPPKKFPGGHLKLVRTDSSQVEIQVLFRALPDQDPSYPAFITLLRVLDDGMSTRLHYRICDRKGLAYHVNAGLDSLGDISLMEVTSTCAPKKLPELTAELLTILRELRESPIREEELAKAKRRYARDLEAGFDDVEGLAAFYGGNLIFDRPLRTPAERYRRMAKVTVADVAAVAKQILQQENMITIVVGSISPKTERQMRTLVKRF